MEIVSVEKCNSYNPRQVRDALTQSLKNLNFKFKQNSKILIKPNLLAPHNPSDAITTHPIILEELCKVLKKFNANIIIGESSSSCTDDAFAKCGINKLKKYARIINFEKEPMKFCDINRSKLKKVPLPKILFDVDLVINVTKMKTHSFTQVTLCNKNLYGCIPGKKKMLYHRLLPSVKNFSKLLFGLKEQINPGLNIIDGIVGIEGEGPGISGDKIKSRLLIAGKNTSATDIVASRVMGFNPKTIWTNKFSKLKEKEINIVGSGKNIQLNFAKPTSYVAPVLRFIANILPKPKIKFDHSKCVKCHLCGKKCPVGAISFHPYPICNHKTCIKCLCCIEVCPHKAVSLSETFPRKVYRFISSKIRGI